jgi:hypothetical protein
MSEMMIKNQLVKIKEHSPYLGDMEGKVLLNSMAHATLDTKTGEYSFRGKLATKVPVDKANVKTIDLCRQRPFGNISYWRWCRPRFVLAQTHQNTLH